MVASKPPGPEVVRAGRRTVTISKAGKVLFPADGITKGALIDYYAEVAAVMLPHVRDRPMTLERYPDGIDEGSFFSKDIPRYFPDWIERKKLPKAGGTVTHLVCNQKATLVYIANQACITPHVGLSRVGRIDRPDQMIFDLDPAEVDVDVLRRVAYATKDLLEEIGLAAFVKSSGSKGLHIVAPIDAETPFDEVRSFARDIARMVAERHPDVVTVEQRKDKRGGRLFLDSLRNAYAQTAAAPWAVRARPGAPVAIPLAWAELDDGGFHPQRFSMAEALKRARGEDPWKGWRRKARSASAARKRLDRVSAG